MSTARIPPAGIFVPVPTFFTGPPTASNPTPGLDLQTQDAHTLHLAKAGITGILYLGSTGEAVALSSSERHAVLSSSRKCLDQAGFKDYPIMAGTASYGVEETVQQCKEAAESGADCAMCLAPGYFAKQIGVEGLVQWYTAVADGSPLPVLIYHYPGVSNNVVLPPVLFEKLAPHKNIVGCKLSHGDLSLLSQITLSSSEHLAQDKFRVFTGLGQQLTPMLSVGGAGAIDGLAGFFPHVVVRLYNIFHELQAAGEAKDHLRQTQRDLQYDVSRAEELVVKWGTVGIKEAIATILGMGKGTSTRLPLCGGMPKGAWEEFEPVISKLQHVEKMLTEHRANVERKE